MIFASNSCASSSDIDNDTVINKENTDTLTTTKIKISFNSQIFTVTLSGNEIAKAFVKILPMTINMTELDGNEKYYDLLNSLPINSSNPQIIKNGDFMLYGPRILVLLYKTFSTSYSHTKLGTIDDIISFASALGSGNIAVAFEPE